MFGMLKLHEVPSECRMFLANFLFIKNNFFLLNPVFIGMQEGEYYRNKDTSKACMEIGLRRVLIYYRSTFSWVCNQKNKK